MTGTFQPTAMQGHKLKVEDVKVDVDYLSYGYWLQETETKPDGSTQLWSEYVCEWLDGCLLLQAMGRQWVP